MDAWCCGSCGAVIKQEVKPISCLLCNRRASFDKVDVVEEKDSSSLKYEEVLKKLEEYEEGTPRKKLSSYVCGCSKD